MFPVLLTHKRLILMYIFKFLASENYYVALFSNAMSSVTFFNDLNALDSPHP